MSYVPTSVLQTGADLRSGTEVLVKKVFHLPSPCAIFYQLRLIALFVNVMNLYNNGLIMTMIMLIMMSLIIAPGKKFFCQTLSITLSAVSPVSLSTAVYSETLPVVRKTVRGVSIISPKVPPYSLQNGYHQPS